MNTAGSTEASKKAPATQKLPKEKKAPAKQRKPEKPKEPTRTPDEWAREHGLWDDRRLPTGAMPEHAAVLTLREWDGARDQVTAAQYRDALRAYRKGPA